jgi:SAM-dependent methyltransferase
MAGSMKKAQLIQKAVASNKKAWNASAPYHEALESWRTLRASVSRSDFSCFDTILTEVLANIGVAEKDVIQLGCNNGRECLSLLGLGAHRVVGVDQSAAFLGQAQELASISPHRPEFIEADVHSLPRELSGRFDVALITIGVLNWIPDLGVFFSCVANTLRRPGTLVIYETHPFLEMFDPEAANPFLPAASYFRTAPFVEDRIIVYEGKSRGKGAPYYWFVHRLSDILTAVIASGLRIAHFKEYAHSNREEAYGIYEHQGAQLPMCYTLVATRG